MASKVAVRPVSSNAPFKRTNLFVVGAVLLYFGNRWFWNVYSSQYDMSLLGLWALGVASFIVATFGLFMLGRAFFNE